MMRLSRNKEGKVTEGWGRDRRKGDGKRMVDKKERQRNGGKK